MAAAARADDRLSALDALRGAAIAGMILVNNPGDGQHSYTFLAHAPWNGLTFADLVFPAFLVAVGAAMAVGPVRRGWRAARRVARRVVLLIALGLVVNGFPHYRWAELRFPGVLQRIALAYLVAWLVVTWLPVWAQVVVAGLLLGGWAWAMTHVTVPGVGRGVLTPTGNLAGWVDRTVFHPNHIYSRGGPGYDPEGLLGTGPSVVTVLTGWWAGRWLRGQPRRTATTLALVAAAEVALAVAVVWDRGALPVNKRLWSPAFVMVTSGVAVLVLAGLYQLGEVWARRAVVVGPLAALGRNAIVAYVGSELFSGTLQQLVHHGNRPVWTWLYQDWFLPHFGLLRASMAFGLAMVALWWVVLAIVDRAGVRIRV